MKESIFTPEAGARRGIPKVLVVLTDGRSQDDVNKVSKEMQMDGGYSRNHNLLTRDVQCGIHLTLERLAVCVGAEQTAFRFLDALWALCHILLL